MDWNILETRVYMAAKKAFTEIRKANENEHFYVFVLYVDSSVMSIAPAANSLQRLKQKIDFEDEENRTEENIAYYKWTSSEWGFEGYAGEEFEVINRDLREDSERTNFSSFKENALITMAKVLVSLVKEGFFKKFRQKSEDEVVTVFVTVTDSDESEAVENLTAKLINDEEVYNYFISRFAF
ncbi:DUF4303 domain-containing protein [Pseudomonas sp. RIT-PI-S]|uniref:DUF4303 domain-containing protein n=1 Tax=Pseudomonas sp. RIT-PI-S TaxID=3035295 RepID=UPI0021DA1921|nr:DUF4303 domain-containing protein [Pseudomonas sp. RIT-PI-S]